MDFETYYEKATYSEAFRLNNRSKAVIRNLVRIWLFPLNRHVNEWIEEVWKEIHYTNAVSDDSLSKYLPADDMYRLMWIDNKDIVSSAVGHYEELNTKDTIYAGDMRQSSRQQSVNDCIASYINKLSHELYTYGSVTPSKVRSMICQSEFFNYEKYPVKSYRDN